MVATSAVVYLIITVSPVGNMTNFQFVYNRLLDTFMGFAIAMAVNWIKLPTEDELAEKKTRLAGENNPKIQPDTDNLKTESSVFEAPSDKGETASASEKTDK